MANLVTKPEAVAGTAYLSLAVDGQALAIPIAAVRDVMRAKPITPVPLASPIIAGLTYAAGRMVTVLSLRHCLGLEPARTNSPVWIVVTHQQEHYALIVDQVGALIQFTPEQCAANPPTLEASWRNLTSGIASNDMDGIALLLDIAKLVAHIAPVAETSIALR